MLYDTKKHIGEDSRKILNKKAVLEKISEYDIFKKYIGDFKIGQPMKSPLRDESNPSFAIFVSNRDNALLYKDLATGDCGDAFKFTKTLLGLNNYSQVYSRVLEDFNVEQSKWKCATTQKLVSRNKHISIKRKPMNNSELAFWAKFGITAETLSLFKVNAISLYSIDGEIKATYTKEDPIFAYKVFDKFKIYRPLGNKINKWRGNLSSLDIMGYQQLPESGDLLIITKSLKDVMVLRELGYVAISPPSETTMIHPEIMKKLKERFKRVIIFYDRDKTGVLFARKIVKRFSVEHMLINKKYKTKDISDFVVNFGFDKAKEFMESNV